MKKIFIYCLLILPGLLAGCQEDLLETFEPADSGSSIYFKEKFLAATENDAMKLYSRRSVSFGYTGLEVRDSLLKLPVAFTGVAADVDREYIVEADPASSMKAGIHYELVVKNPVIRAGRYTDTLQVKLLRTADLQQDTLTLGLVLKPNGHFNTRMAFRKNQNGRDSLNVLRYDLDVDDITGMPAAWTDPTMKNFMVLYFGEYSRAKLLLLLRVLEFDVDVLAKLPASSADKFKILDKVIIWSRYMVYWLGVEKQAGRTYKDENGKEITMGTAAG